MERNLKGVKFIGWFQIIGAIIVLLSFNVQQNPAFNVRFGVEFIPESLVKISVVVFGIIIGYGYLKYLKWAYCAMMIYSVLFCIISLNQLNTYGEQIFYGNFIYAGIVIIYTFYNRRTFIEGRNKCRLV